MKKAKKETTISEAVETMTHLGRPSNPNSARQQRLAAIAAKIEAGIEVKRGRPADGKSARQHRLAEMEAKRIANGGEIKRGRPTNGTSARQQRLAAIAAKIEAGMTVKRGRPAMPKEESVSVEK